METDQTKRGSSLIKLPGPGEDATPTLIPCYVRRGNSSFRSLNEFDQSRERMEGGGEEFKLYLWRSTNLREIATILFIRDSNYFELSSSSSSTISTLFAFRIVRFDEEKGYFIEKQTHYDISRLSNSQISSIKKSVERSIFDDDKEGEDGENEKSLESINNGKDEQKTSKLFKNIFQDCISTTLNNKEFDELSAKVTLDSMGWQDGDILDCILYEPSLYRNRQRNRDERDRSHYARRLSPSSHYYHQERGNRYHREGRGHRNDERSNESGSRRRRSASPSDRLERF